MLLRRAQGAGLCRPALHQLAPGGAQAQAASERELPYQLLRRAADYEVRRYPLYVAGQHRVRAAALAPLLANERKCREYDLTEKELRVLIAAGALLCLLAEIP